MLIPTLVLLNAFSSRGLYENQPRAGSLSKSLQEPDIPFYKLILVFGLHQSISFAIQVSPVKIC